MRVLTLHLKAEYWHAIARGEKAEEYRLANDYWGRRLRGDESKTLRCKWVWYPPQKEITHAHFGDKPVMVYAIDVTQPSA